MSISKSPIFDGMEFVNRDSVTNEILTESTTIPIVVQDGKLKINSRDVGGSVSIVTEEPPNPPNGIITLYVKGDVLYGKKSNGNVLTFEYDTGVGDFTGSGVENGFAYWTAVDNISATKKLLFNPLDSSITVVGRFFVQQGINIELTNGDETHGLKSSNGICIGNATGITPDSNEISLQRSNTYINCLEGKISGGVPSDILITNAYIYGSNENGQLSVDEYCRLKYNTFLDNNPNNPTTPKNVILGTTDGGTNRIPFFDDTNSLTSSANLIFDGALKVNGNNVIYGSLASTYIPVGNSTSTFYTTSGFRFASQVLTVLSGSSGSVVTNKITLKETNGSTAYHNILDLTAVEKTLSDSKLKITNSSNVTVSEIIPMGFNKKTISDVGNLSIGNRSGVESYTGDSNISIGINGTLDDNYDNNIIIGNNSYNIHHDLDTCDNCITIGSNTIGYRTNDFVLAIDNSVQTEAYNDGSRDLDGNPSVKGEIRFTKTSQLGNILHPIFSCFTNSMITFDIKCNIIDETAVTKCGVFIKGCFSVDDIGNISWLRSSNSINAYTLDPNTPDYAVERFGVYGNEISLNIATPYKLQFNILNSLTHNIRIDGVISYVESRF